MLLRKEINLISQLFTKIPFKVVADKLVVELIGGIYTP